MARPDELTFAPLGGVGEIGMNLSIYGLGNRHQRSWLAVDLGVSFGDEEHLPGIDTIMPDIRFLEQERKNLVGLVLTHAHEDHFGAIIDLWPRLKCPIYATRFSAALFEAKCASERNPPKIPVTVVPSGGRIDLGPFSVEFIPVAHSIPEAHALAIHTEVGTVLHTGDWKIDRTPIIGPPTDERRLRELGDAGVLALIGDSTNAVREGRSPSEAEIAKTIGELVKAAKGRVAVTTFASNVARLRAVADAARLSGREVVVVGRAMERVVQVARETGHLDGVQNFRGADLYGHFPPDKVLALCTGSQGEPRAALSRIANDDHPQVTLNKGDCVIFSSRTIPGNEKAVGRVQNALADMEVEVITDQDAAVHVSGHPRRGELEQLYAWVKPDTAIPMHGEGRHLEAHAKLAERLGVRQVVRARNGTMVRLLPGPAEIIDEVPVGRLYRDGAIVTRADDGQVRERRKLSFAGAVAVSLVLSDKGALLADPEVAVTGLPLTDKEGMPFTEIARDAVIGTIESLPKPKRKDQALVSEAVRRSVRAAVNQAWGKKPMCSVLLTVL
jgi:ribonuclease J